MASLFRGPKLRRARKEGASDDLSGRLVTVLDPTSTAAEAYRTLRTNLFYAIVDTPPKVIVVTSASPREGKSTTCANLGVVLAQADRSVLIVDSDFRRPVLHKIFGLRNLQGAVNVLTGERVLQEVWHEPLVGLKVVTVGPPPPNPAELLSSKRFAEFIGQTRQMFDYVLIDAPPVQLVSDSAILANQSDGVLFVVDAQNTRKGAVRQSVRRLQAVGATVIGTVMNNAKGGVSPYSYGYGYTYK